MDTPIIMTERRQVDEDFKEWMKSVTSSMSEDMAHMKEEISTVKKMSVENRDALKNYLLLWKGIRYAALFVAAIAAGNMDTIMKMLKG